MIFRYIKHGIEGKIKSVEWHLCPKMKTRKFFVDVANELDEKKFVNREIIEKKNFIYITILIECR